MEFTSTEVSDSANDSGNAVSDLAARRDTGAARERREVRATRKLFDLLQTREELQGVYAPADHLADTLRWSA